jgi:hypothetical protein
MRIKIVSCRDSLLWYSKHIGEVFEVVKVQPLYFWCREKDEYKATNFIHKNDVEILEKE